MWHPLFPFIATGFPPMFISDRSEYRYDTPAWAGGASDMPPARGRDAEATAVDTGTSAKEIGFWGEDGFTFGDLVDLVNPLQQLPIVGTVYRAITGDSIAPGARMLGSIAFGGPVGLIGAMMENATTDTNGATLGDRMLAWVTGDEAGSDTGGTALADAGDDSALPDPATTTGMVDTAAADTQRLAGSAYAATLGQPPREKPAGAAEAQLAQGQPAAGGRGLNEDQFAALLGAFGAAPAPAAAPGRLPATASLAIDEAEARAAGARRTNDRRTDDRRTDGARPSEREIEAMLRDSIPGGGAGGTPLADLSFDDGASGRLAGGGSSGSDMGGRIIPAAAFLGIDGPTALKPRLPVTAPGAAAYAARQSSAPRPDTARSSDEATQAAQVEQLQALNRPAPADSDAAANADTSAAAAAAGPLAAADFAARMNQALDRYQAQMRASRGAAAGSAGIARDL
ncbi:hypothetical protein P7L64_24420 [Tistrella bauzanensis]|nr:hypothetical protein [Tistrella bauzanensis]